MKKELIEDFDFIKTFPPLGHQEHHFNKYPSHNWLMSKSRIKDWLLKTCTFETISNEVIHIDEVEKFIRIHDDLTVSINKDKIETVRINYYDLKFKFRDLSVLSVIGKNVKNLIGMPYNAKYIEFYGKNKIKDFYGMENIGVVETFRLVNQKLKNFKYMPKNGFNNLIIPNNPIESWDGFTRSDCIYWWQNKWCKKTSYELIFNSPLVIKDIRVSVFFEIPENIKIKTIYYREGKKIDIYSLKNEIDKENAIKLKNKVDLEIDLCIKNNKRKL